MLESGLRKWIVPVLVAGMAACTHWSDDFDRLVDQSGRDFKRHPGQVYTEVDFASLVQSPSSYKLANVRFWALLNRKDEGVFVTMYSTFRQEDYYAFSLWPLDARVWEEGDRVRAVPTFYLRKDSPDFQKVVDAPRYSVIRCQGRVMGDYDSGDKKYGRLPFVEVISFDVAMGGPEYDDEAIKLMAAGLEDADQKRSSQAVEKLSRAIEGTLGMAGRAVALVRLGLLYEERGRFDVAVVHYELALEADPDSAEAAEGLRRAQTALERKRAIEQAK